MRAVPGILTGAELAAIRAAAEALDWQDGGATAGARARKVKANHQAAPSPARDALLKKAEAALLANPVFAATARPRALTPLILSRYREGQTYGLHVDDALMRGLRTDLSFTLFLSDPDSYDGGALEIEDSFGTRSVKLPAGAVFAYPATTLHRVAPVTSGTRLAIVGWAESWIRDPGEREILFSLDQALATIEAGTTDGVGDVLAQVRSNLLRRWAGA